VKLAARLFVIAVIGETAGLFIKFVRPVTVSQRSGQYHEPRLILFAENTKSALDADTEQRIKRVIAGVAMSAPFVDGIDDKICVAKIGNSQRV
jgi:hypothetical protein